MQVLPAGIPGSDRQQAILREVSDAQTAIEGAEGVRTEDTFRMTKPQGSYVDGEVGRASWSKEPVHLLAVCKEGDTTVVLRADTLKKDTTGVVVAASIVGAILGHVLFGGRDSKTKFAGEMAGAGVAAWGANQLAKGAGDRVIERIQSDPQGVTVERVKISPDGNTTYTNTWRRTGPLPPVDVDKAKEYIDSLKI